MKRMYHADIFIAHIHSDRKNCNALPPEKNEDGRFRKENRIRGFFCEEEILYFLVRLMTDKRFFVNFKKEVKA